MKKLIFAGFLLLSSVAIVTTAAIKDSNKSSASVSAKSVKKTAASKDLLYYRNILYSGSNAGC